MQSDQIIEKIRNKLKDSDPSQRTVMNIFQFHFTDSDGNLIKSVELNIYEGKCSDPDAEVTVSDDDFFQVGSKQITFDELIEQNKAKIEGDQEAFQKMTEKFRLNSKK